MMLLYLGLDFIIRKDGKIYIIEGNSSPGGTLEYKSLYGNVKPLEDLAKHIKSNVDTPKVMLLYPKSFYERNKEIIHFKERLISKKLKCDICIYEDRNHGKFVDIHGNVFEPNVIITPRIKFKKIYKNFIIVNPLSVSKITSDKYLFYKAMKKYGLNTPETFLVLKKKRIIDLVAKNKHLFNSGLVIKPRCGFGGKKVHVLDSIKDLKNVKIGKGWWVLQERILPELIDGKFWDIRIFVVGHRPVGGFIRVSKRPVVNLSRGGKAKKLSKKLFRKIAPIAKKASEAIEKYATKSEIHRKRF